MKYKVFVNKGAAKSLAGLEKGQRALMAERLKGLEDLPNSQLDTVKIASEDNNSYWDSCHKPVFRSRAVGDQ